MDTDNTFHIGMVLWPLAFWGGLFVICFLIFCLFTALMGGGSKDTSQMHGEKLYDPFSPAEQRRQQRAAEVEWKRTRYLDANGRFSSEKYWADKHIPN